MMLNKSSLGFLGLLIGMAASGGFVRDMGHGRKAWSRKLIDRPSAETEASIFAKAQAKRARKSMVVARHARRGAYGTQPHPNYKPNYPIATA